MLKSRLHTLEMGSLKQYLPEVKSDSRCYSDDTGECNPCRIRTKTTITAQTNRQPPYRVLIVDDEPDIALALKMGLEQQQGFQVTTIYMILEKH